MKVTAFLFAATLASTSAFAPAPTQRVGTALNESIFSKIANMDLWAPISNSNDYGARNKKNVSCLQETTMYQLRKTHFHFWALKYFGFSLNLQKSDPIPMYPLA